jgi:NADP-dependent 3-hydroxy acid dehydrogenase YdfG
VPGFVPHPAYRPVLIAGASSGIGAATAILLAQRGFPVALGARRLDKLAEIVETPRGGLVAHMTVHPEAPLTH